VFYGPEQAGIHHRRFGRLAATAADHLLAVLAGAGHHGGTVVDLGCGSGILAARLTAAGYDVLGVDLSPDMVAIATATAPQARFVVGSLHDVDLPPCVAVTAVGEALDYAADPAAGPEAVARLAGRVAAALAPGGVWLLDVSGPGRAGPTGTSKQFHRHDDWCLGMTATESAGGTRLDREVTIFTAEADGRYRRVEEHHVLHLYERGEMAATLRAAGFAVEVLDDYRSAGGPGVPGWYVVEAGKPR
jgi:SAM-dependent methyltransferase